MQLIFDISNKQEQELALESVFAVIDRITELTGQENRILADVETCIQLSNGEIKLAIEGSGDGLILSTNNVDYKLNSDSETDFLILGR